MSADFNDLLRLEDHDIVPTCLSAEPHMPQDFILHYLGCEQFFQREEYLTSLSSEQAQQVEAKLRRIHYVRTALANDLGEGRQYIQNLGNSIRRWRGTRRFQEGIDRVRELRTTHFAMNGNSQREPKISNRQRQTEYNPDVDTHAYMMRFKEGRLVNAINDTRYHEQYPCYRISMQELLQEDQEDSPLIFPKDTINYLHLPANNMQVRPPFRTKQHQCRIYINRKPSSGPKYVVPCVPVMCVRGCFQYH